MAHYAIGKIENNYITNKINSEIKEYLNKNPEDVPNVSGQVVDNLVQKLPYLDKIKRHTDYTVYDTESGFNSLKDITITVTHEKINPIINEYNPSPDYFITRNQGFALYNSAFHNYSKLAITIAFATKHSTLFAYSGWQKDFNNESNKMKKNALIKTQTWFNKNN